MNLSQYMPINLFLIKKESTCIPCKHKSFWQLIKLAYFAISRNANFFNKAKRIRKIYFREEKNEKFKE